MKLTEDARLAAEELRVLNTMAKLNLKGFVHLPLEEAQQANELFETRSAQLRARIHAGMQPEAST